MMCHNWMYRQREAADGTARAERTELAVLRESLPPMRRELAAARQYAATLRKETDELRAELERARIYEGVLNGRYSADLAVLARLQRETLTAHALRAWRNWRSK